MVATFKATLTNYADALAFLGGRVEKVLAHNTIVVNYGAGTRIHVLYHGNIIATFYRDATDHGPHDGTHAVPVVRLRDAGWSTVTTTGRLHRIAQAVMGATARPEPVSINRRGGATNVVLGERTVAADPLTSELTGVSLAIYADGYARVEVDVERLHWER